MKEAEYLSRISGPILAILLFMVGLSASMPEERVVPASDVLAKIKAGQPADFDKCTIVGDLDLSTLIIDKEVYFNNTIFQDSVNCSFTIFGKAAYFRSSSFKGSAYFGYSKFNGTANFYSSNFNGYANFGYSIFNITSFDDSIFAKSINFRKSVFKTGLALKNLDFDEIYLEWDAINNISRDFDGKVYLSLIERYKARGFYSDADNCYYEFRKEQFFHRKITDDPLMYLFDLGAWIFYGFGKRPLFALIWSAFLIVLFGGFWIVIGSKKSRNDIDEYSLIKKWPENVLNALFFSATLFLSGTKLFVDPPAIPELQGVSRSTVNKVFIAERLLGALFSILFFLAITGMIMKST